MVDLRRFRRFSGHSIGNGSAKGVFVRLPFCLLVFELSVRAVFSLSIEHETIIPAD